MQETNRKEAMAQLFSLYHSPMLRLALRILGEPHDAEDAVQDAFESISRNLEHLDEPESTKTRGYVMVITERKAIDLLRAKQREDLSELDEDTAGVDFPDTGEHGLAWCMTKLPSRYREILMLRFVYGYSMREAAELMDIPLTTVGKLSQRAKERLYELCRKEDIL